MALLDRYTQLAADAVVQLAGDAAVHTDASYTQTPCRAVVRVAVEVIGDYAQVVGLIDTVTVLNREVTARSGDSLTITEGAHAGEWRVGRKQSQSTTLTTFEAIRQ